MELPSHVRSRSIDAKIYKTFTSTPPLTPRSSRLPSTPPLYESHPFSSRSSDDTLCLACGEVLTNPLTLSCDHVICGSCAIHWSVTKVKDHHVNCPLCKEGGLVSKKLKYTAL